MFHKLNHTESSHPRCSLKKEFFKKFPKFYRKILVLKFLNFFKKILLVKFAKVLSKSILRNIGERLLLIADKTHEFSMKWFLPFCSKRLVAYLGTKVFDKWILKMQFGFATEMFTFPREIFTILIDAIKTKI